MQLTWSLLDLLPPMKILRNKSTLGCGAVERQTVSVMGHRILHRSCNFPRAICDARLLAAIIALVASAPAAPAQQQDPARNRLAEQQSTSAASGGATVANISTRMLVGTDANAMIGGFIITGTAPKKVILRAIGPTLDENVPGRLADPTLELFQGTTSLGFNDNWKSAPERAEIEASTIPPGSDLESAMVRTLNPGAYTAVMRGKGGTTGVGLIEVYDLALGADSQLANISTRGLVQTGANVMIAGTIVLGDTGSSQRVLVRAIGPSLPVAGKLANPTLTLVNGNGVVVRANDNWRTDQEAEILSTLIPPPNELESALVETLQPGRYTAIVGGAGNSTGVGLVEAYALSGDYGSWALAGDDPNLDTSDDLEPLRWLIGDDAVAAFGESYHTSGGFYRMKHRVFRFLVEEMGFRAFAIESNWEGAELAAAYVRTGNGTAEQAISQHINVWQSTEYAELVEWMADWNRTHANPADKLTLFGFDIQQPEQDGPGLVNYLERIGIPKTDPRSAGLSSCEGVDGQRHPFGQIPPERHDSCVQTLAAIQDHFTANKPDLVQRTSEQEYAIAMLRVVGLRAWEDQVFFIAHNRPAGYSARDEGMAYAFQAMRAMKAPNAKTMIWAANSHVARTPLVTGEVPMGSHLANVYGENYANFALNAFTTEIDFPGLGCGAVQRPANSLEDALAPVLAAHGGAPAVLVDTRGSSILEPRVYPSGIDQLRPHLEYDGVIYLERSPKFDPLVWAPCQ